MRGLDEEEDDVDVMTILLGNSYIVVTIGQSPAVVSGAVIADTLGS